MKSVSVILGVILLAQLSVATAEARLHNSRLGGIQNESYYSYPNNYFERGQLKARALENCSVWGHYITPCE